MDGRPSRDNELVFDAHPLYLAPDGTPGRVDCERFDSRLGVGRGFLDGTYKPTVALAGRTREHFLGGLQLLLGLLSLQIVDGEPVLFYVIYN
jgi:hypothetical protein